jgi:hypothetical protein
VIYDREQVELPRNLMAGWMGRIGFHLAPLVDRVLHHIRVGERIFADETKAKIARLWTCACDTSPSAALARQRVAAVSAPRITSPASRDRCRATVMAPTHGSPIPIAPATR